MTITSLKKAAAKLSPDHRNRLNKKTLKANKPLKRGKFGNRYLRPISSPSDLKTAVSQNQRVLIAPNGEVFREMSSASGLGPIAVVGSIIAGTDDTTREVLLKGAANDPNISVRPAGNVWG